VGNGGVPIQVLGKKIGRGLHCNLQGLLFQDAFEPVTDEGAHNKDEHEEYNLDKNTEYTQETDTNTYAEGNKEHRDEHENNTQNDTDDRAIFKEAQEVFLPMVKKAKCYTDDKIQQLKPHVNTPDLKQNITLPPLNRFRAVTGISARDILEYNAVRKGVLISERNTSLSGSDESQPPWFFTDLPGFMALTGNILGK
jgi:hypothetical protein